MKRIIWFDDQQIVLDRVTQLGARRGNSVKEKRYKRDVFFHVDSEVAIASSSLMLMLWARGEKNFLTRG